MDFAGVMMVGAVCLLPVFACFNQIARHTLRAHSLGRLHGPSASLLLGFGSKTTWCIQSRVLGRLDDDDAMAFTRFVQDECTMVAVAAAIVAQISVTALSLDALSQAHWAAKGFFAYSLASSLTAVYFSTTQRRDMSRFLNAKEAYINNPNLASFFSADRHRDPPCDPSDYVPQQPSMHDLKLSLMRQCFVPSVGSVITLSAPQMLLKSSLSALLVAVGVYFGYNAIENVFVVYIVSLVFCGAVYSLTREIQTRDGRTPFMIVEGYMTDWVLDNPTIVQRWNVTASLVDGKLEFTESLGNGGQERTDVV
ncbi:hypothetical protein AJ80_07135 [Polytolypa hystricis UAMH7299]|uniref:Uncharacterized protein n=1 Tax=Polytolypa hystricis (strain UAMH7299) TaxID=1447883 RepID=A0A2B7XR88_POLH7|nr:hypothetical protein AJ80_07135 [Polytolypa hystricis UAMH7299]